MKGNKMSKDEDDLYYAFGATIDGEHYYFLWQHDHFFVDPENGNLVTFSNVDDLFQLASMENLVYSDKQASEFNFDLFWQKMQQLCFGERISNEDLPVILNGWNNIEDFARTYAIKPIWLDERQLRLTDQAYERIGGVYFVQKYEGIEDKLFDSTKKILENEPNKKAKHFNLPAEEAKEAYYLLNWLWKEILSKFKKLH